MDRELIHPDQERAGLAIRKTFQDLNRTKYVGMTTKKLNDHVVELLKSYGAKPACRGYLGFPEDICVSLNDESCHGIPTTKTVIKAEDVVKVDIVAKVGDWHADACHTFYRGKDESIHKDIYAAYRIMWWGLCSAKKGKKISNISKALSKAAEWYGMNVVREFSGHGIGQNIHQQPMVPAYYDKRQPDHTLKVGDVITVEPIVTRGSGELVWEEDGWTNRTKDSKNCYMFEETILITPSGIRILT